MSKRKRRNKRQIGEALAVLDSNNGAPRKTARELNMPKSTLASWKERYEHDPEVAHYRTMKNAELAEGFRVVAAKALDRLVDEVENLDVNKLAVTAAICTDKQLLLTGQPTSIVGLVDSAREIYFRLTSDGLEPEMALLTMRETGWPEEAIASLLGEPEIAEKRLQLAG